MLRVKRSLQTVQNVGFVIVRKVEYWPTGCFCNYQAYAYSVLCSILSKLLIVEYLEIDWLKQYMHFCVF